MVGDSNPVHQNLPNRAKPTQMPQHAIVEPSTHPSSVFFAFALCERPISPKDANGMPPFIFLAFRPLGMDFPRKGVWFPPCAHLPHEPGLG
jgi:hypothetical protein